MSLAVSRPEKELWDTISKADLAEHYRRVAAAMLPHLKGRPMTLVRAPNGIDNHRFFQKDAHHLEKYLRTCTYDDVDYVLVDDVEDLVRLADQAVVEIHGWTSLCAAPDRPDRLVFDLDPPGSEHFDDVRDIANDLCVLLRSRGATPHPMVTGSKGIHVVVPLVPDADFDAVRSFTTTVGEVMVDGDDRLTMELRKAKRGGRIFMDTLRNRPRQTAVMPYSTRARDKAPVAWPIRVKDLEDEELDPRLAHVGDTPDDAWSGFFDRAVPLSALTGQAS